MCIDSCSCSSWRRDSLTVQEASSQHPRLECAALQLASVRLGPVRVIYTQLIAEFVSSRTSGVVTQVPRVEFH